MTIEVNAATIYYEQQGEGKPLLLLHGWGLSGEAMAPIARDFSAQRRVISLDFPGHGHSPEPPAPWSVTEYMEATAGLIRKLGIAPCDIVAHSFGGRVAILLSATYPELVRRMILTGCAGLIAPADAQKQKKRSAYQRLRRLADNALTRKILGDKRVEAMREALVQKYGSPDYRVLTPSMRKTFNRVIAQDLRPYLNRIQASTLLVWGREDAQTPLWMGQVMEKEIPDAGLVVFDGVGHYAFLERYGEFRLIAGKFLLDA